MVVEVSPTVRRDQRADERIVDRVGGKLIHGNSLCCHYKGTSTTDECRADQPPCVITGKRCFIHKETLEKGKQNLRILAAAVAEVTISRRVLLLTWLILPHSEF